jgi:glycosyltransferase involved in cell wall biosynthesis
VDKVSIIVSTLNEENCIGSLLSDIAEQTKDADEITIVNGRSKDGTVSVVERFSNVVLLLDGRTLYVVRNEQELIVPVKLSGEYISGEVGEPFTDPSFAFPTTLAKTDGRLLVVNSQFDKQEGEPELPFTVSSVEVP